MMGDHVVSNRSVAGCEGGQMDQIAYSSLPPPFTPNLVLPNSTLSEEGLCHGMREAVVWCTPLPAKQNNNDLGSITAPLQCRQGSVRDQPQVVVIQQPFFF